jgi:hypothetical protein
MTHVQIASSLHSSKLTVAEFCERLTEAGVPHRVGERGGSISDKGGVNTYSYPEVWIMDEEGRRAQSFTHTHTAMFVVQERHEIDTDRWMDASNGAFCPKKLRFETEAEAALVAQAMADGLRARGYGGERIRVVYRSADVVRTY